MELSFAISLCFIGNFDLIFSQVIENEAMTRVNHVNVINSILSSNIWSNNNNKYVQIVYDTTTTNPGITQIAMELSSFWPIFNFNNSLHINREILTGNQCYTNAILASSLSQLEFFLTWALKKNRVHCDAYLIIGLERKKLPNIIRHFPNFHRLIFANNPASNFIAHIKVLSHSFGRNNQRLWKPAVTISLKGTLKLIRRSFEIVPKCEGCEYIDVFRTAELAWHNGTEYGYWVAGFTFHEHNMSFTWRNSAFYHMTKMLSRKYKIKQTVKFLIDIRTSMASFNFTVQGDNLLAENYEFEPYLLRSSWTNHMVPIAHLFNLYDTYNFYTALPKEFPAWQAIFYTYDYISWITIAGAVIIMPIMIRFLQSTYSIGHIYAWIMITLTGQGKQMFIVNKTSGIAMFSWLLGSVILSYGFTSSLIAALSKPALEKPPHTWQDLLDRNYTILTPQGEWSGTIFRTSTFDDGVEAMDTPVMNALFKQLQAGYSQTKYKPFWHYLFTEDEYKNYISEATELAVVFFNANINKRFHLNSQAEKILHVGNEANFGAYYGLDCRKNNLYNEVIFAYFQLLIDMGVIQAFAWKENRELPRKIVLAQKGKPFVFGDKAEKMTLQHFYGPIIFMAAAYTLATLIFAIVEMPSKIKMI